MNTSTLVDFIAVCDRRRLTANRGVAALVHGVPIALFSLADGSIHVIDNTDPFSGAGVLSRGLIGDVNGAATVASPMHKQRFALATGVCIDDPTMLVRVHEVRVTADTIEVRLVGSP